MSIDTSKIIHGVVGGGRYTVTSPIVKEDYGLYLKIEGLELPSTYEVDFSNSEHSGTSVTMIGNSDGVLIPSQFIASGKDIFAFLYHVGVDYGRTVYKFRIPNKLRPDRTDEEPTPEQQSVIDQAISALNDAVEQTAQDKADADASAQSASESAEQARESARTAGLYSDTAQTYANSAEISANSASASATASAQSAEQSAINSADAQDSAEEAQASASASAQSATASANSASQALSSATSASQSASSASGYATSAQSSAQTASTKASEASTSASTASQKVTEASQSATNASQSAQTAEQAKTASQTAQGLAESARDDAIDAKTDAESARDEAQNIVDGISAKAEQIDANTADIASLEADIYKPYVVDSASGSIASFVDGADDIPLKSFTVTLEPQQDTSQGEPSPENICPITGHTGFNLYRTGGNLICKTLPEDAFVCGSLSTGDTTIPSGSLYRTYCVYVGKNTAIQYKKETTNTFTVGLAFADEYITERAGSVIYNALNMANRGNNGYTLNSGEHPYLVIVVAKSSVDNQTFSKSGVRIFFKTDDGDPIEYSPPRNIDKYAYDWTEEAGTVYGGKLDVLSGVMTVTHTYQEITKAVAKNENENGYFYYATAGYLEIPSIASLNAGLIADRFKVINNTNQNSLEGEMTFFANNIIRWKEQNGIAVENYNQWLAENPFHICYKLSTPQTYQLTPHEVNSLLGANNIFADTGDTTCEYRADTRLYIEKLTQPTEDDMVANSAITSGQFFMIGNTLYKALTAIASGATITVGTNAQRVSLADALNLINT